MNSLGVLIASDITKGPTTKLVFLGLDLDSEEMVVLILLPKLEEIKLKINEFPTQKKCHFKTNAIIDRVGVIKIVIVINCNSITFSKVIAFNCN